ncbi:MAG: rhodanese-like domain-containing protein [Anaerolineae bacterium]
MFNLFKRKDPTQHIDADGLRQRIATGEKLTILDVRETSEYNEAHIDGSKLIPLNQLSMRMQDIPRDRPIVAVCRSGNRSSVACDMLRRAGYENVLNLDGGLFAWHRSGYPLKMKARKTG